VILIQQIIAFSRVGVLSAAGRLGPKNALPSPTPIHSPAPNRIDNHQRSGPEILLGLTHEGTHVCRPESRVPGGDMSEANKQLARRWFEEVWNKQRCEAIAEMLTSDSVLHEGDEEARGPEGFYPFYDRMQAAFSEIKFTVYDALAEGDKVCLRWSCTMRHTGPGLGVAPTNKQLHTTGISIVTVANGMLGEGWQNWDMLSLIQQVKGEAAAPTYIAAAAASK
jgi:predicted ester cyclase